MYKFFIVFLFFLTACGTPIEKIEDTGPGGAGGASGAGAKCASGFNPDPGLRVPEATVAQCNECAQAECCVEVSTVSDSTEPAFLGLAYDCLTDSCSTECGGVLAAFDVHLSNNAQCVSDSQCGARCINFVCENEPVVCPLGFEYDSTSQNCVEAPCYVDCPVAVDPDSIWEVTVVSAKAEPLPLYDPVWDNEMVTDPDIYVCIQEGIMQHGCTTIVDNNMNPVWADGGYKFGNTLTGQDLIDGTFQLFTYDSDPGGGDYAGNIQIKVPVVPPGGEVTLLGAEVAKGIGIHSVTILLTEK